MDSIPQKPCMKCGALKHPSEPCKACKSARNKARYQQNREQVLARTGQYQRDHPDAVKRYQAAYHERNLEMRRESSRQCARAWRTVNRDRDRAAAARWVREHPEQKKAHDKAYSKANPEKRRAGWHRYHAQKRANGGAFTEREWRDLKARYDHRCLCCGKSEPEIVLTVDHIIPISMGGSNDLSNIQPLCFSCNSSKGNRHTTDYR